MLILSWPYLRCTPSYHHVFKSAGQGRKRSFFRDFRKNCLPTFFLRVATAAHDLKQYRFEKSRKTRRGQPVATPTMLVSHVGLRTTKPTQSFLPVRTRTLYLQGLQLSFMLILDLDLTLYALIFITACFCFILAFHFDSQAPFTRRRCENETESLRIVSDTIVFGQSDRARVYTKTMQGTFKDAFVWSDDEVELLSSRVDDYKTSTCADWDTVSLKQIVIRQMFQNVSKNVHQPVINPFFFFFSFRNISQKENEKKIDT